MTNMKRAGRWKSATVVEGYVEESKKQKQDIATVLQQLDEQPSKKQKIESELGVTFNNCTFPNCKFEIKHS